MKTFISSHHFTSCLLLVLLPFLPRDAMRKRGLCCRPVSVRLSVKLVYILSTRLKLSSNFFVGPVATSF